MTHDELVSNLGTVARSGTTKFMEALKESGNTDDTMSQIGQFGVGFYSAFLVSDRVTVASKHPTSPVQHVWESTSESGDFLVYPDPRGSTLERGTEITLHLKEDAMEYADQDRLRELTKHFSEFVVYPISLRTMTTMTVDVEDDEEEGGEAKEEKKDEDDLEVGEDEEASEEEPKKKTKEVQVESWDVLNGNKAIWTREKDSITEEEYQSFWSVLSGEEHTKAASYSHFEAEGNINFKSLLYLPEEVPIHYRLGNMDPVEHGMRLFVRRVMISDSYEFLPKYLGFIRGVVDSDDLPLNVNRESLQESKIIKIIKKKVVRKCIEMIKHFADKNDTVEEAEVEVDDEGNVSEPVEKKDSRYVEWYKKFSPNLKLGVIEDEANRSKLIKLLRFQTSKSDGQLISLDTYLENMKEWQDQIYVLGGTSVEEVESSPYLEIAKEKDVEVVYMLDPIDEYMVKQVLDYKDKKFTQISSESAKFKDEDEDLIKRREKAYKKKFDPLMKWMKKIFTDKIFRVQIAKKSLGSIPAIVSSSDFGNSANMERIMRAQALQHGMDPMQFMSMKVLEINPRHPLILKLLEDTEDDSNVSQDVIDGAWMIFDMAMLNGGFNVADAKAHNKRIMKILKSQSGLASFDLEPEINPPEEEDEPPEVEGMGGLNMEDFNLDDLGIDLDDLKDSKPQEEDSKTEDDDV